MNIYEKKRAQKGIDQRMDWHTLSAPETVQRLDTDSERGLSEMQASERLIAYGENTIGGHKRKNLLVRFLAQFSDFMVIILIAAAAVSFAVTYFGKDGDYVDSVIILAIVILNAIIGMIQESRAERAIDALKKLSNPHARVLRSGKRIVTDSASLVPGDIVFLDAGDLVPADGRLLSQTDLYADESAITGESVPAEKYAEERFRAETPLGDRKNMVFCGSSISRGNGMFAVTETGEKTQMGRIAQMIRAESSPQTPLQQKLAKTGKILGIGAITICALIFGLGLLQKTDPLSMFMMSVSLAVAAIPEGLPAVVTIVLAMGVRVMAAKHAIVRSLPAVETLGSASVICSDKTGTLTQNRMTVTETADAYGILERDCVFSEELLRLCALCNNTTEERGKLSGEPTENALVRACDLPAKKLNELFPRVREIAFSSARKMMTTVHRFGEGYRIITKGAPDFLLPHCSECRTRTGKTEMTTAMKAKVSAVNAQMASRALRVIGVAVRDTDRMPDSEHTEENLIFCGLIGMIDPPRPRVRDAVKTCMAAGIRPVMITGDHRNTAAAIAKELGILEKESQIVTGEILDKMTEAELKKRIGEYRVFARVSPEHKVRIVRALQAEGEIVAMTGDGVNDAPALKAADIGCAMGKSGTDVAKAAADLVLTDDDFSTIVAAVREGRGIYDNIRKTVHFLLSCNIGEILTVFVSVLLRLPAPLLAIQLLWVNLVTDSLPALSLGMEKTDRDIMKNPPKKREESIFSNGMGYDIAVEGLLIGAISLLAYSVGRRFFDVDPSMPLVGRTMSFAVLSLSQVAHAFNIRSERSLFSRATGLNGRLLLSGLVCILLQMSVIVIPTLASLFGTVALSFGQWAAVAAFSVAPILLSETEKWIHRTFKNHKI